MSSKGLSCSICLESLRNPRELPCHHSFCETCLGEFIDKLVKNGKVTTTFNCPICRSPSSPFASSEQRRAHSRTVRRREQETKKLILTLNVGYCNSCEYSGERVDSSQYCTVCCEYMCEECSTYHRKFSATRNHKLTDVTKDLSQTPNNGTCQCVSGLSYYCPEHEAFFCGYCKTMLHSNCKCIRNCADMSEDVRFHGEVDKSLRKIDAIKSRLEEIVTLCRKNVQDLEAQKATEITKVHKLHARLRSALTKAKTLTIKDIQTTYQKALSKLTENTDSCNMVIKQLEETSIKLKSANEDNANIKKLAPTYKNSEKDITQLIKAMKNVSEHTKLFKLYFAPNKDIEEVELKLKTFGNADIHETTVEFTENTVWNNKQMVERSAKYYKSIKTSDIANIFSSVAGLPNGLMVVVNFTKYDVIMYDSSYKYVSAFNIPGAFDAVVVGKSEVAVTTRANKKIQFLSTEEGMAYTRIIDTERHCYGIAYCRGTKELIITTHRPSSVQILTLDGNVVKTITKDNKGQKLFSNEPDYVAVNYAGDILYVSDMQKGVLGMGRDGVVKFIYSDIKNPRGLSIDGEGNVYACGYGSSEVHQLTPDGIKSRVLLSSKDGIDRPMGLFFNRRDDTLAVSLDIHFNNYSAVALFLMA